MSIVQKHMTITPEEYPKGEQYSDIKHEYVAGRLYAMVGASETDNLIVGDLHAALHARLCGGPCRVFVSDMNVRIQDSFNCLAVLVSCENVRARPDRMPYDKVRLQIRFVQVRSWK